MVSSWQACIRAVQFVCVLVHVCSVRVCVCVSLSPEWDPLADSGNWSGEWRVQLYSDPYSHVPLLSVMVLVLSWHLPGLYVSTRHLWALNYFRKSHPQSRWTLLEIWCFSLHLWRVLYLSWTPRRYNWNTPFLRPVCVARYVDMKIFGTNWRLECYTPGRRKICPHKLIRECSSILYLEMAKVVSNLLYWCILAG